LGRMGSIGVLQKLKGLLVPSVVTPEFVTLQAYFTEDGRAIAIVRAHTCGPSAYYEDYVSLETEDTIVLRQNCLCTSGANAGQSAMQYLVGHRAELPTDA